MNTNGQPEKTITVLARYIDNDPTLSEPKKRFSLGELPIIDSAQPLSEKSKRILPSENKYSAVTYPFDYVEFLHGSWCVDQIEGRVGIRPRSEMVLYDVPISVAESFKTIPGWKFEKLSWTRYRQMIESEYNRINKVRNDLVERLSENWVRFYNIKFDANISKPILFDVRIGKTQIDSENPSSDRYHWHVNLKRIRSGDLFSAIEYFEQALYLLNVDCSLTLTFDETEIYRTPEGLTYDPKEEK